MRHPEYDPKRSWHNKLGRYKNNARAKARSMGFSEDFRSGFELNVAILLKHYKIPYEFETDRIPWVSEPKPHNYTPDFKIRTKSGKLIYLETKGLMDKADREKHIAIRNQHPDLDIRLIFSNPHTWDRAAKTRSYAKWADENGFTWTSKAGLRKMLLEWIKE